MSSAMKELESALRTSLFDLLRNKAHGLTQSVDVQRAITDVLGTVHRIVANFASESNRVRPHGNWYKLPVELRLETVRWLGPGQRARLLRVSRDIREHLLENTSLWTTIAVPETYRMGDNRAEILLGMLARSGDRPLDIDWPDAPFYMSDPSSAVIHDVAHRIRTLAVDSGYVNAGKKSIWAKDMPLLEKLEIKGRKSPCTLSPDTWSADKAPVLREVKLLWTIFKAAPRHPFRRVAHFEGSICRKAQAGSWNPIWHWFPQLESLVLRVYAANPPTLPPPPASLRRVALHGMSSGENAPVLILRDWKTHNVRLLQVFSNARSALTHGARFLCACTSGRWDASFAVACCPSDGSQYGSKAVLRAETATVVVWSRSMREIADQVRVAHANKVIDTRPGTLTLSHLEMFDTVLSFAHLRTLTFRDTTDNMHRVMVPNRVTGLKVPKLTHLIVDLTSAPRPQVGLCIIHELVTRFLILETGNRLQELTVLLPASIDRQSPEIAKCQEKVANVADNIRIDYLPRAVSHDDSCPRAVAHV